MLVLWSYGKKYLIDTKTGNITQEGFKFSGQWKFLGLKHVRKNQFIPINKITPKTLKSIILTFKNGNPQYTIRDLDHGTLREWGNTKVHGVKNLYFQD